ncbi:MAG: hypothetical protein NTZ33_07980 [Bacteroidetes bacterium]|nr:hypothetical protein [Bacteroidota bacterium]
MKKPINLLLFIYIIIAVLTIVFFNGTGDSSDSITHYLYARYAPIHPELFFNHWSKPVFVLLSCPFAQFGFSGIKIFNAIVSVFCIFFTYRSAELLKIKNAIIVAVIMMFAPLYYILTFSGLTEPLFALFLIIGIYLSIKKKFIASCILISFLPFVRSEGLIVLGVFSLFLLFIKQWKFLPLLLSGHLVYSIAGFFVYHDFLWVLNKIPYANIGSPYGSGNLTHFFVQMIYVTGIPIYLLFWAGVISIIYKTLKKNITTEISILVLCSFMCFFISHTLFWYFGIFNSMGLHRVLIGVMPIIAVISLYGFNFITEELLMNKKKIKISVQLIFVLYIVIFPFTSNPAAINWKRDMMLSRDQQLAVKSANFVITTFGTGHRIVCSHPYLCEVFNIDFFDYLKWEELNKDNIKQLQFGDIVIWENWFAEFELKINKADLDNNKSLENLLNLKVNENSREIYYSVYIRK